MELKELMEKRMPTHGMREALDIRFFYRWVSLPLTYIFYHIGLTANVVSYLMISISILSAILIYQGEIVVGIALWQLWLILDSVDGEIARLRKECSSKGWFLDLVFENFCFPINFIAIGFAFDQEILGFAVASLWILGISIRYNYLECLSQTHYNDEDMRNRDGLIMKVLRYLSYGEFKTVIAFWALVCAILFFKMYNFLYLLTVILSIRTVIQIIVLGHSLSKCDDNT